MERVEESVSSAFESVPLTILGKGRGGEEAHG